MRGCGFRAQQILTFATKIKETMIDQIIEYNKSFVAQKIYETHPFEPKVIVVRGVIVDSETGA